MKKFQNKSHIDQKIYKPILLRLKNIQDEKYLDDLLDKNSNIIIIDNIKNQLIELIKIRSVGKSLTEKEIEILLDEELKDLPLHQYGVWVYYPWSNKLVHLVEEREFVAIRTNRNLYKITPQEIAVLESKKIGVIGLSVGQSIALTLAMERVCGELHLADFDTVELSNMNRLYTSTSDIGINKAILAARKIAELDPFIKVTCYTEGITEQNIDEFIRNVDILVEECDSIYIKILSRLKAKKYKKPVVMDTNDKGMLDVERFDLESNRNIFHGRLAHLEDIAEDELILRLRNLSMQEKIGYLSAIIGMENVSDEMKFSLSEMNKSITGWPQLASSVTLGGAMITDVCRRIVLGKFNASGRYIIDLKELIN